MRSFVFLQYFKNPKSLIVNTNPTPPTMELRYLMFFLLQLHLLHRVHALSASEAENAEVPPRGWNSYDSFIWIISEEEFLQSADIVSKKLLPHGYQYVVVDYLWYRRKVGNASTDSLGYDVVDQWGRPQPDPERWPSSRNGKGFTEIAKKVHRMGLKFGFHIMRGISTQAFNMNTLILDTSTNRPYEEGGRIWRARDIALPERTCAWMKHGFMSVNTTLGAGKAFFRSLIKQYAEWDLDFLKHDCVFGTDFSANEISYVSQLLQELDRPVVYSISPGTSATPALANNINELVNMYRVAADDWDTWGDVASHFNIARDFAAANMTGVKGLRGKSWPDLDMLPFGWLGTLMNSTLGPHRTCGLTFDEQKAQITLWAMARSPIMFGGDMRKLDNATLSLITNPTILHINSFSSNNQEFTDITGSYIGNTIQAKPENISDDEHVLGVTSCSDPAASGWSSQALAPGIGPVQQVCWFGKLGVNASLPFCLNKNNSLLTLKEGAIYAHQLDLKLQFFSDAQKTSDMNEEQQSLCLDASPTRRITSKETRRGSFAPCHGHASQNWELHNGTLMNGYNGMCLAVVRSSAHASPTGIRSWIATGSNKGEYYIAFFNLSQEKMVISAKMAGLAAAIPGINGGSCSGTEIWSGKELGLIKDSIAMEVEVHGTALFVLKCTK